jgi:hypothetical protein
MSWLRVPGIRRIGGFLLVVRRLRIPLVLRLQIVESHKPSNDCARSKVFDAQVERDQEGFGPHGAIDFKGYGFIPFVTTTNLRNAATLAEGAIDSSEGPIGSAIVGCKPEFVPVLLVLGV